MRAVQDMGLFDYFDLHLFHAWVEPEVAKVVGSMLRALLQSLCSLRTESRGPAFGVGTAPENDPNRPSC